MKRRAALFALLLLGCETEAPGVGSPCEDGDQCAAGSAVACIVSWPDGYCTEYLCEVGSCPQGARCVRGITFVDVPVDAFCLAVCETIADCREGYRCGDVGMPEKVCVPKTP